MAFLDKGIDQYINQLMPNRDPVLIKMEDYAKQKGFPIIGPQVGTLLAILTRLKKPAKILELGSGYGYSAMWFALHSTGSTTIYCTDGDKKNKKRAGEYFKEAGVDQKIQFHVGDALEFIDSVTGPFDIIFNDIDKEEYPEAFKKSLPKLNKGGLLVTDNTLWRGQVADGSIKDKDTEGIREYNRLAFGTSGLLSMVVPLRDGVTVSYKIE